MSEDQRTDEAQDRRVDHRPGEPAPITPDESPSALERGARIFERLRRRS